MRITLTINTSDPPIRSVPIKSQVHCLLFQDERLSDAGLHDNEHVQQRHDRLLSVQQ